MPSVTGAMTSISQLLNPEGKASRFFINLLKVF